MEIDRYIRHSEFVTKYEQERLHGASVLIAGCGIGSITAVNLARIGVGTRGGLILADPERVEIWDLNRQEYSEEDLGQNKAEALARRIRQINHEVNLEVISEGVTKENIPDLVNSVNIVVDAVDISQPHISFRLHEEAEKQNRPLTTGLDVGEGVIAYVFDYRDSNQMPLRRFLGLPRYTTADDIEEFPYLAVAAQFVLGPTPISFVGLERAKQYYETLLEAEKDKIFALLPGEMHNSAEKLTMRSIDYIPQINSAATLHGSLQSVLIRGLILGYPVRCAPTSIRINLLEQILS